jgi:hypothetical protein
MLYAKNVVPMRWFTRKVALPVCHAALQNADKSLSLTLSQREEKKDQNFLSKFWSFLCLQNLNIFP